MEGKARLPVLALPALGFSGGILKGRGLPNKNFTDKFITQVGICAIVVLTITAEIC